MKTITDGLRIDNGRHRAESRNIKPGLVETNFSRTRFHGDNDRADNVYKGIKPLTGDDIADVALYAASAGPCTRLPRGACARHPSGFRLGDCEEIIPGASGITLAALCEHCVNDIDCLHFEKIRCECWDFSLTLHFVRKIFRVETKAFL